MINTKIINTENNPKIIIMLPMKEDTIGGNRSHHFY